MKLFSKESWEATRPDVGVVEALTFCLDRLYADDQHEYDDIVADFLTYEELIGALLVARDEVEMLRLEVVMYEEEMERMQNDGHQTVRD